LTSVINYVIKYFCNRLQYNTGPVTVYTCMCQNYENWSCIHERDSKSTKFMSCFSATEAQTPPPSGLRPWIPLGDNKPLHPDNATALAL